jgi:hypothetical protein
MCPKTELIFLFLIFLNIFTTLSFLFHSFFLSFLPHLLLSLPKNRKYCTAQV